MTTATGNFPELLWPGIQILYGEGLFQFLGKRCRSGHHCGEYNCQHGLNEVLYG